MNSFNFQIVPVANLAAIVTPFPDHICYFTEDTENYYIWENDALKEIFVDASSITWNNVTNKPTTITGFGITDAVKVNNGTLNYLAKFTPNGTTIGNSIIQDNGTSVAIGKEPSISYKLDVAGSIYGYHTGDAGIGIVGENYSEGAGGIHIAVKGNSYTIGENSVPPNSIFIGGQFVATGSYSNKNYSVQLQDGTQSVAGRYLRNMTTDGKANWANINITEVTNGLSSTLLGAPNGIATLDSNSKLTIAQMPISVMDYKGTYDITTNTPNLQDGVGNQGDVYVATTAGTRTFGVGNTLTVSVGDWLIYNGTKWEKTLGNNVGSGTVTSVGLSLGTTGTDVSVSNSPITSSGNINLNIPTASSTARGLLSSTDWTTFNDKIGGIGANNFLTKFSPNGKTIADAGIQENNLRFIGVNMAPDPEYRFAILELQKTPLYVVKQASSVLPTATTIAASMVNKTNNSAQKNIGLYSESYGSSLLNVGVESKASGDGSSTVISGIFRAEGSSSNLYSLQLKDGTETVAGRFLKNMTTDGKANWANITAADVSGAVGAVGGTNNYIAKFTPNGTTIGNSKIQDNGTNVYIDDALTIQQAESKFLVSSNNTEKGIQVLMPGSTNNSPVGIVSNVYITTNTKSGTVSGGSFSALGSSTKNIGLQALANQTSTGVHIGIYSDALNGALGNYAIQLRDGSETATGGKFLKDKGDGKANWTYLPDSAQIMCSDMVSAITADTSNPKAIWVAPCDGQLTDAFASLRIPQAGGTAFTVLVKTSLVTIATLTFSNGNLQFMSTNPAVTQAFTKGNIFELYVSQVGDGSARSLLVTLNYLRT